MKKATLKNSATKIAQHVRETGVKKSNLLFRKAGKVYSEVKEQGLEGLGRAGSRIKNHPAQTIAVAFTTGVLVSYLFRRK